MTTNSTCNTSLDLCGIRVAKLTSGGAPSTGASNGYFSDAPIKLQVTVTTEAGTDETQKNGCGALMATLQEPDKIKGIEFALDLCQLDAELLEIQTGGSVFVSGGNAVGAQLPAVGAEPPPVCFEGWSKAWDGDAQVVAPLTTPNATYIHWVFPFTRWVQGAFTLEHKLLVIPVTGKGSENTHITANGPFNDWPVAVTGAGGVTRLGGWFFDATLPTNSCTYVAVTSAAS